MSGLPHYFIAIQLPKALQEYYSSWQDDLKDRLAYKQWTAKQDLHITLKFLGPTDDNKLSRLKSDLTNNFNGVTKMSTQVGSIGVFGNSNRPRVLFVEVERNTALSNLQEIVEKTAENVGFTKEKRTFHPHITLAKKWVGEEDLQFKDIFPELRHEFSEWQSMLVEEVVLFKIHPENNPKYEIIDRYTLKNR
ncbi:RNA 2',3'-cyclic phosphodiesterase [Oceanobacillus chungangensis]|uniref:RNA 2',3'-cyclic phosphodiesterase n=1 Tax=Oceanobacillus chungangensis TaxID=1229152 RepID=A0A3D8PL51_9BACI|nr:RNA 2',3'-cyclic phosphodiesterase [Oceanobacillus chungangensis]RDW15915.1 RNA 2',3'-cyclic phosphodiesterase [Oceanobacillus chungangensis]